MLDLPQILPGVLSVGMNAHVLRLNCQETQHLCRSPALSTRGHNGLGKHARKGQISTVGAPEEQQGRSLSSHS